MSHTYDIERTLLVSVLEKQFVNGDKEIQDFYINPDFFNDNFHKKLVVGINRLKQLGEPIDAVILRNRFNIANSWNMKMDDDLISIMSQNPIGTISMFKSYYKILINQNINRRYSI